MGLAGAKNKRKLGNDPNNTKWSRNTETFGQKMLKSQGWEPGQYLGVQGAEHAQWHTEANSTHIRVTLKDDQLGLGAKRNNGDECTGLDAFQTLLGRLNGKSEDVLEAEKKVREDHKLNVYVERKLGTIRFVSGGFLVGDQVVDTISGKKAASEPSSATESAVTSEEEKEETKSSSKRSKKRKADEGSSDEDEDEKKKAKKEKKDKKEKKRKAEADAEPSSKDKDKKKSKKRKAEDSDDGASDAEQSASRDRDVKESKKERKERREREKREKKERKEKRREEKAASKAATETGDDTSREKKRRKGESDSATTSGVSTPTASGTSTPTIMSSSRYLSRQRFIAQKKLAFTDTAALNQIFMIKS
ncbi:hypothetical protein B0T16DRAFT_344029 [Cercophora newfieldiana]|uniref:PinX1-related protein 1 n=1 Tax=Cercophora newfieldiana TaxID=92897 RepID=A0AA39YQA9_9PEZI|nr:hypothetical protein B0T16DRAFT_344029 [Cercophora newfieldiana]